MKYMTSETVEAIAYTVAGMYTGMVISYLVFI